MGAGARGTGTQQHGGLQSESSSTGTPEHPNEPAEDPEQEGEGGGKEKDQNASRDQREEQDQRSGHKDRDPFNEMQLVLALWPWLQSVCALELVRRLLRRAAESG
jgi:hypothetical protein